MFDTQKAHRQTPATRPLYEAGSHKFSSRALLRINTDIPTHAACDLVIIEIDWGS